MIRNLLKAVFIVAAIAVSSVLAKGANGFDVSGVVVDSASNDPVPFASVKLMKSGRGKVSDKKGRFTIKSVQPGDSLIVTAMGYSTAKIAASSGNRLIIPIAPDGLQLKEVIVRPRKEKYSKKNNPAVDFVNSIRNRSGMNDPRRNDFYSFDKYERITIALNDLSPDNDKNIILKKFGLLKEYIDTSEVSGSPIINISMREKFSINYYRKEPKSEKEFIDGVSQRGLDDFLDEENMRILYEDFFNDIDLYQNDIYLLHNKFVSPLGRLAPDFYKFYLTDTVDVGGEQCIELSFVPHNAQSFGFTGKIYVPQGDSTMFIRKVVMNVPRDINLNFIKNIYINQEFQRAPDGSRLLMRDDLIAEVQVMPGTQGLYFRRNTAYSNHSFDPNKEWYVYEIPGKSMKNTGAIDRDSIYWDSRRYIPLRRGEAAIGPMSAQIRKVPFYYWTEKVVKLFATGYINTAPGSKSKFDIGPVNTIVSHNSVEGYRFRLGGMTTANLSPRLFARGYGAYGLRDHRWKYGAELEYSFHDKRYHPREFPIHALRLTASYDMDQLGQHYAFTNPDNMFLSFKRHEDRLMTYRRIEKLEYILELENNFSLNADIEHCRQEPSACTPFIDGNGQRFGHYDITSMSVSLRYAPGEKFYQTKTARIPIAPEKPVVMLSHKYAPKGFAGNRFAVSVTELSLSQCFWFSAFGYLDAMVKGGHLWTQSPYPNLLIPNANLSYTIQPESFALMDPMEFINDSYAHFDLTYWANGAIFNYIPLLRKLKLREVFAVRGLWGHLSRKNRPELNPEQFRFPDGARAELMTAKPYVEASVGIDNIFKILRVDYVWRLTYREGRASSAKGGVRIALHFTF